MKRSMRRLWSFLLTISMVLSSLTGFIPGTMVTAMAEEYTDGDPDVATYNLWVGGIQVTSANMNDVLGDTDEGAKVKFTPASGDTPATLTLNNATINGSYKVNSDDCYAAIYVLGINLTIDVTGDNTVTENGTSATASFGIITDSGNLTVKGSGKLNVTGGMASGWSYGIQSNSGQSVTVKDGATLIATGGVADRSYGIFSDVNVEDGGTVVAAGGDHSGAGTGIYGKVTVGEGGTVTASGGSAYYDSTGICSDVVVKRGGTLNATGNTEAIYGNVKNAIVGTGWTDAAGETDETEIPISTTGQNLNADKTLRKVVFGGSSSGSDSAYSQYIPTADDDATALADKTVSFNGIDWYIVEDESSSATEGSVTLFAKNPIGACIFDNTAFENKYSTSTVKTYLDGLTGENGSFADVAELLKTVQVKGADSDTAVDVKLYILSETEAESLPNSVLLCDKADGADYNGWWLRTPHATKDYFALYVNAEGPDASIADDNMNDMTLGVRPALKLDLGKVTFSASTREFTYNTASTVSVINVTLDKTDEQTIAVNKMVSFTATVSPNNATDNKVIWSVEGTDPGAVTLYSDASCETEVGMEATDVRTVYAKGMSAGSATVTVTSNENSGISASCDVEVTGEVTEYNLWVGGIQVTSANKDDVLGDADEGAKVKFTPASGDTPATLTLNNATITGSYKFGSADRYAAIYGYGFDLIIDVHGDNTVTESSTSAEDSSGIYLDSRDITATGSGKLNVTGGTASRFSYGIKSNSRRSVTVKEGATLIATGGVASGSYGINADVNVEDGGTVVATGGDHSGAGTGIYGKVTVGEGGTVTAFGGSVNHDSIGICSGVIVNEGGTLTASGYTRAIDGNVKNAIVGTGWGDVEDEGAGTTIPICTDEEGQFLFYNKIRFPAVASIPVTDVTLDKTDEQTIAVNETVSFNATVSPNNATDKKVIWSVEGTDPGVVTLYSDASCETEVGTEATDVRTVYAKGMSAGCATVMVTSNENSGTSASCEVEVTGKVTEYNLWVGGIQVTSANKDDVLGDTDEGATVKYTPAPDETTPATLTLNNATINGSYKVNSRDCYATIYGYGFDLIIDVHGDNTVTESSTSAEESSGIYLDSGNLTVTGSGKLNVTGGMASGWSYGIQSNVGNSVTVKDGATLIATGGVAYGSYGIDADVNVEDGGTVVATGNTSAIGGNVKNAIVGTGWGDIEDDEEGMTISICTDAEGRSLSYYRKIRFGTVASIPVTDVTLDKKTTQAIQTDDTVAFTATVSPSNATDKKVIWSVEGTDPGAVTLYSDASCETEVGTEATDVRTVYAKGISTGSATVKVTSNDDPEISASCNVKVVAEITNYGVWIGGTRINSENRDDVFEDGTVSYTPATTGIGASPAMLKLNGYTYEGGKTNDAAIYAEGNLIIELTGDNTINFDGVSYGVYQTSGTDDKTGLTICGNGTLTVKDGDWGICVLGDITIDSGSVIATAGGMGISAQGGITINGGEVEASTISYFGAGISAYNVTINDGIVKATASGNDGIGIYSDVVINGGTVTATGGKVAVSGTVKNAIGGKGWTDMSGTGEGTSIPVSTKGRYLSNYKKVHFEDAIRDTEVKIPTTPGHQDNPGQQEPSLEDKQKESGRNRDKVVELLGSKGSGTVAGIYQNPCDTLPTNYIITGGKITGVGYDASQLKEGVNRLTMNTGTRILLSEKFTVSDNFATKKEYKKAKKFVKQKKSGCYLELGNLGKKKSYELILVSEDGKKILVVDAVKLSLNKKIKKIALTTTVSADQVGAKAVSENKIGETGYAEKDGVVTITSSPVQKSEITGSEKQSARFISGIWMVGKTAIYKGQTVTVKKGKAIVNAKVNDDGTLSIAKDMNSGKGKLPIKYILNGKVTLKGDKTKMSYKTYKTFIKVK